MTSPKLQILERRMARHSQPERIPAPATDDLTAAIERLVQERVSDALEQKQKHSPKVQRLISDFNKPPMPTDYRQLPPVPKTTPKKPFNVIVHRDGAGLIRWMEMPNGLKIEAVRDGAGNIIAMREITESPVLPPPDIDYKAKARKYDPGTPRT